jgi:hypothetical protein
MLADLFVKKKGKVKRKQLTHTSHKGANKKKGKKSTFPSSTFTKVRFSSLNSKIGQITSLNF